MKVQYRECPLEAEHKLPILLVSKIEKTAADAMYRALFFDIFKTIIVERYHHFEIRK